MNVARVVSVRASTISHATENQRKVEKALLQIFPNGLTRKLWTRKVKGHYGNEMVVYWIEIKGTLKPEAFFSNLASRLSQREKEEILSRTDMSKQHRGILHIRIDKQESLKGRVILRDSDPIKIQVQFGAQGLSRNHFVEAVRSMMNFEPESEPAS